MVKLVSPKNRRAITSSFCLLNTVRNFVIFIAGVMVGIMIEKSGSIHDTAKLRHDYVATRPFSLESAMSRQRTTKDDDGWKAINIFYGSSEHFESLLPRDQKFYSQARQDEVVLSLLRNKTNGYFVDLASNDATSLSNSYALERHYEWKGLCIEPNPTYWYNLTHARQNCELIGAVVGKNRMDLMDFKFNALDHGGIVGDEFDNGSHLKRSSSKVYTVTLSEIFKKFDVPQVIDYLSLDVEGAEEFILTSFPLADYRIRIMTIERPKERLRKYLESHGYTQILRLSRWGETLWIHSSFETQMDMTHLQEFHGKKQYEQQKAREQELKNQR